MRAALLAAALAFACAIAYALWVQPGFEPAASDQVSYLHLARGLVDRGEYTRAPLGDAFAPEPLRPPGYPLFLAPLCLGGCDPWRVAIAQALLYGALVLLTYGLARIALTPRGARIATFAVALYLPLAYFSALALSDLLSAFLLVAALAAFARAVRTPSPAWAVASGSLLGWLALTRATYVFFPLVLVVVALLAVRGRIRGSLGSLGAMLVAFVIVLVPLFTYSATYFGRPFASSSGSAIWLGAVQGVGEADLDPFERDELVQVRADVAAFDQITDRVAQAYAWIALNERLAVHGERFILHDPLGYLARTPVRALVLWAGDLPVPNDVAPTIPGVARALVSAAQLALFLFGTLGAIALARRRSVFGLLALAIILYVSAVGVPLGTEARYSLAAKPVLLVAAVAGVSALRRERASGARA